MRPYRGISLKSGLTTPHRLLDLLWTLGQLGRTSKSRSTLVSTHPGTDLCTAFQQVTTAAKKTLPNRIHTRRLFLRLRLLIAL